MVNALDTLAPPSGLKDSDGLARSLDLAVANLLTSGSTTQAAGAAAIPVTHRFFAKTIGSAGVEALTLADGVIGQEITINCAAVGTGTATITPATASGFTVATLIAAGDNITLKFIDAVTGWVVQGAGGVLAPPLLTA